MPDLANAIQLTGVALQSFFDELATNVSTTANGLPGVLLMSRQLSIQEGSAIQCFFRASGNVGANRAAVFLLYFDGLRVKGTAQSVLGGQGLWTVSMLFRAGELPAGPHTLDVYWFALGAATTIAINAASVEWHGAELVTQEVSGRG